MFLHKKTLFAFRWLLGGRLPCAITACNPPSTTIIHDPEDVQRWVITLEPARPAHILATFLGSLPQHLARSMTVSLPPDSPLPCNPFGMLSVIFLPSNNHHRRRKRTHSEEATHHRTVVRGISGRPLTEAERELAEATLGQPLDPAYQMWDIDREGQWFQDICMPPCTLPQVFSYLFQLF